MVTDRSDAALRDPARIFGLALACSSSSSRPALLLRPGARRRRAVVVVGGFAALALLVLAIGYPLQRHYLSDRFASGSEVPGMHLDSAYAWARDKSDARIGLAGTTAGFLQYGFYGTDLSNRVIYLGEKGPHGAFNAIPTCAAFRTAVNAADLDYLVTTPFLNFIHTGSPVPSPEAGWLRGDQAATPIKRDGPATIWRIDGKLDPSACGPANAPLRRIPDTLASRRASASSRRLGGATRLSRRVVGLSAQARRAGAADDDLVGVDADRDLAFAGPVLGVDRVVLDRRVEPEAVAVGLAVVEGCLEVFATAAASAAAAAATPFRPVAARLAGALLALVPVAVLIVLGLGLLVLLLFGLFGGGSLDLGLDLVAEIDFAAGGVLLVGGEAVLFAELAQLGGADFELVGDPGVRAALADPGADLVELWLQ